jgi:DNA-binding LacI/PurR family transcriptional regulator
VSIDVKNPKPLYLQIAEDLLQKIQRGELKTGESIGSHNELAKKYNVSLITIRKARAYLNNEGVLFTRIGKGTYVEGKKKKTSLSQQKTIGFVLRDLESQFFSRILASVEKNISKKGYNLLLSSNANQIQKEDNQIKNFIDLGVDGLIIVSLSSQYHAPPIIRKLETDGFPYVVVSYVIDKDICHVGTDQVGGAYTAVEYLINLGYRKIGYLNGEHGNLLGEARKTGYIKALSQHGIPYNEKYIFELEHSGEYFDYNSGYRVGVKFSKLNNRPEAVFAYNDLSAIGFEKGVLDQGLHVPKDVSIVGFDDIKRCITAPVQLTTVHQPIDKIGSLSVETLLKKINNIKVKYRKILQPTLVERESCCPRKESHHVNESELKELSNSS